MAVNISVPQVQKSNSSGGMGSRLLTLAGMAAGAYMGAPSIGAAAGASLGGQLGGMAGGIMDPVKQTQGPPPPQAIQPNGAVERRLGELNQNPMRQIRESINSLQHIPDQNLRAQVSKPLFQAAQAAKMRG